MYAGDGGFLDFSFIDDDKSAVCEGEENENCISSDEDVI